MEKSELKSFILETIIEAVKENGQLMDEIDRSLMKDVHVKEWLAPLLRTEEEPLQSLESF